ncbi:TonB-dependent receptor [Thiomicrorhabdus sp.]|uniref:TonB-dependent receptor n=1 Tax=Thiomicrorhabdus sp. TaxID=2039724 RepID=UPI0029C83393|nr:TonB-dependent receptor [Thiomicrorhabdus sp.]
MRNKNRFIWVSGLATLLPGLLCSAYADEAEPKVKVLKEITVKGEAMEESNQSFTVNIVDRSQIEERNSTDDVLRLIEDAPGMTMSTGAYAAGGIASAFEIRGFSGGGHGSDAAVYIDGIPLNEGDSHADGFADTNILIPIEVEKLSIYKGPVSPLFGNFARGGTLAFDTRKGGSYQEADVFAGSFNTFNAQAALGGSIGDFSTNFAVQAYNSDGFRDNQEYVKSTVSGRVGYKIDDDSEVVFSLRGHNGKFNSPGYIEESQYNSSDRYKQAPTGENDGGNKGYYSQRIDYNTMLNNQVKLLMFGYAVQEDFVRFAKFSYTASGQREDNYHRDVYGFGTSLNGQTTVQGKPASWVAGVEYYDETTGNARYDTSDRVRTGTQWERRLSSQTTSAFAQMDIAYDELFIPTFGFRYDMFDGNSLDKLTSAKSSMNDYSHFSPKLGVRSNLSENWQLRASAANGYALPDGTEKYDATIDVNPVEYWQYEIGISGTPAPKWFVDLAAFVLDSTGEYQTIGGNVVNYGETRRTGLEGEIHFNPVSHVELSALIGLFDSEILKSDTAANVGKSVTNVPKHVATFKASYAPPVGLGGSVTWRSIGEYYLTGDNSQTYGGFNVVDLTAFYNIKGSESIGNMKLYARVNNVFDEVYSEAAWYGATTNYAPAAPRNLGVGVTMKF